VGPPRSGRRRAAALTRCGFGLWGCGGSLFWLVHRHCRFLGHSQCRASLFCFFLCGYNAALLVADC